MIDNFLSNKNFNLSKYSVLEFNKCMYLNLGENEQ